MSDDDSDLPLAERARNRRARLVAALAALPEDRKTERSDLQVAIDAIDAQLTGNTDDLPESVARSIVSWLDDTKYLAL